MNYCLIYPFVSYTGRYIIYVLYYISTYAENSLITLAKWRVHFMVCVPTMEKMKFNDWLIQIHLKQDVPKL